MREHDGGERPYFQQDLAIGEVRFHGEPYTVRLQLHQSEERFTRSEELFPLTQTTGTRTYFHAKPYILVPDFRLTIETFPSPRADGAIGKVTDSEWEGMRHQEIGQPQAWYYPGDRALMLWECYLHDSYQRGKPQEDPALATLWSGFEQALLARLPEVQRLFTTWEDIYARADWQRFLTARGYEQTGPAVFSKARL
jgi:hypothetical protein